MFSEIPIAEDQCLSDDRRASVVIFPQQLYGPCGPHLSWPNILSRNRINKHRELQISPEIYLLFACDLFFVGGGLAQLVTSLIALTKLINTRPG